MNTEVVPAKGQWREKNQWIAHKWLLFTTFGFLGLANQHGQIFLAKELHPSSKIKTEIFLRAGIGDQRRRSQHTTQKSWGLRLRSPSETCFYSMSLGKNWIYMSPGFRQKIQSDLQQEIKRVMVVPGRTKAHLIIFLFWPIDKVLWICLLFQCSMFIYVITNIMASIEKLEFVPVYFYCLEEGLRRGF